MPHKATFCRDLRSGKIVHFCRKTGRTRQIAAMDGSRLVVKKRVFYYRLDSFLANEHNSGHSFAVFRTGADSRTANEHNSDHFSLSGHVRGSDSGFPRRR